MHEEKKIIEGLANWFRHEVPESELAELAGSATRRSRPAFVDWRARIDGLNFTGSCAELGGQLRALLYRLLQVTREVGGRVVPIGKRIVKWILEKVERYPATSAALLVMAALSYLVGSIPFLGGVLLPIAQLVAVGVVGFIFFTESCRNLRLPYSQGNR